MPAIFIGRFQPFHNGHLAAIKWILKKEKEIFIIIGSSQESSTKNNPFSFSERKEMIEKTLLTEKIKNFTPHQDFSSAGFKIYGIPDFKDDIFWAKQIFKITKLKPENTVVFTKNPWTKRCFQKIGVRVKSHPIFNNKLSGMQIRKKIVENEDWKSLIPETVFNFLKKIDGERRIKSLNKKC